MPVPGAADAPRPFRRRFLLHRAGPDRVEAQLEDHLHHVAVEITHDDRVLGIAGRAVRLPWSTCPSAADLLSELVGTTVGRRPSGVDGHAHCTHLLDCALAAIRFAGTSVVDRTIELTVTSGSDQGTIRMLGQRDDGVEVDVVVDEQARIVDPVELRGRPLGPGFSDWAPSALDAEQLELAVMLRRGLWMRYSTTVDLDDFDVITESGLPPGSCYSSQPQRSGVAVRNRGSSLPTLPPLDRPS